MKRISNITDGQHFEKEKYDSKTKDKILKYLKSFEPDCAASPKIYDYVKNEETKISLLGYNDGDFWWGSTDMYYFEHYDLRLRDEFINHVLSIST